MSRPVILSKKCLSFFSTTSKKNILFLIDSLDYVIFLLVRSTNLCTGKKLGARGRIIVGNTHLLVVERSFPIPIRTKIYKYI